MNGKEDKRVLKSQRNWKRGKTRTELRNLEWWLRGEEGQRSVPSTTHMETQCLLVQVKGDELPHQVFKDSCRHAVHKQTHP